MTQNTPQLIKLFRRLLGRCPYDGTKIKPWSFDKAYCGCDHKFYMGVL